MIVETRIDGRPYQVIVPDDAPEHTWEQGVVVGPPDLSPLELTPRQEERLHNELYARRIITAIDCVKRRGELVAAIMAALSLDAERVYECYMGILIPPEPRGLASAGAEFGPVDSLPMEVADNG